MIGLYEIPIVYVTLITKYGCSLLALMTIYLGVSTSGDHNADIMYL